MLRVRNGALPLEVMNTTSLLVLPSAAVLLWACATAGDLSGDTEPVGGGTSTGGKSYAGAYGAGGTRNSGGTGAASSNSGGTSGSNSSGGTSSGTLGGSSNAGASNGGSLGSGGSGVPQSVIDNASVVLYYKTSSSTATTNQISFSIYIENKAADPLPLANVEVRYWMTSEAAAPGLHSYYAGSNISGAKFEYVDQGAESHVGITFGGNTISKSGDLNLSEVQLQLDAGLSTFEQTDDWSWQPEYKDRKPHDKITVYLSSKLIWGCEPSGTCAGADPSAGGASAGSSGSSGAGPSPSGGTGPTSSGGGVTSEAGAAQGGNPEAVGGFGPSAGGTN